MMRELKTTSKTNIFFIKTMKTKFFLSAAVMTVALFSSCSNETNGPNVGQTGTLKLTVTGTPVSRATGTLPKQTIENTVSMITVGLFDHNTHVTTSITEVSDPTTLASGTITIDNVPTSTTQDVVVVANTASGTFKGLSTLDAFRAKTLTLAQTASNLPMSGENVTGTAITASPVATANVTISRLVARVQLASVKTDFSSTGVYANASFKLDSVFVYNVNGTSAVGILSTGTQLATSNLLYGYGMKVGSDIVPAATGLFDALSPSQDITSTAYTTNYYYYTFENYYPGGITDTNKQTATKLVLAGTFYPDKGDVSKSYHVYYPVVVNRDLTGTVIDNSTVKNTGIQRNNIYSITAVISGIGASSPAAFIEPASLKVNITISDWNLTVGQTVNF